MAPFYGWGLTASRLEPLRGGSLSSKFIKIFELIKSLCTELFQIFRDKMVKCFNTTYVH